MERDFRYLRDKYTDAGAREIFEKICSEFLHAEYGSDAHRIAICQGDGGIDILIGEIEKSYEIYQCKYFIDGIGDSQKKQIRESFEQARQSSPDTLKHWYLCLPCDLNIKEFKWWSKWKSGQESLYKIPISLYDGGNIISRLKRHDIYKTAFDDDIRLCLDQLLQYYHESKRRIYDELLVFPSDDEEQEYDGLLFVKKLECAKIRNISGCKRDFFNAEYAKQCILSKADIDELRMFDQLRAKIYSFWETQFRLYQDENDGNELLTRTYQRIEDADTTTLQSINTVSLLAKKGILHQWAEECHIGWMKDYVKKLEEYLGAQVANNDN